MHLLPPAVLQVQAWGRLAVDVIEQLEQGDMVQIDGFLSHDEASVSAAPDMSACNSTYAGPHQCLVTANVLIRR
jgi:hypothetical protein